MAGKVGRSGPPGNLNHVKHPWKTFWRRRALKAEDRWVLPRIESYAAGLEMDKPDLSNAEARMIEIAQTARGATMLILSEAARSGFIVKKDGSWDLAPGAKDLSRFLMVEKACLKDLGLDRRANQREDLSKEMLDAAEACHMRLLQIIAPVDRS